MKTMFRWCKTQFFVGVVMQRKNKIVKKYANSLENGPKSMPWRWKFNKKRCEVTWKLRKKHALRCENHQKNMPMNLNIKKKNMPWDLKTRRKSLNKFTFVGVWLMILASCERPGVKNNNQKPLPTMLTTCHSLQSSGAILQYHADGWSVVEAGQGWALCF